MEQTEFENNTILKLRRKYGKDELVKVLTKQLKECQFENGVLKSEVAELGYKLNSKTSLTGLEGKAAMRAHISNLELKNKNLVAELKNLRESNKKHKMEAERLLNRICKIQLESK